MAMSLNVTPKVGNKYIGERIRKAREILGFTQAQLGEQANIKQDTISDYENGTPYITFLVYY